MIVIILYSAYSIIRQVSHREVCEGQCQRWTHLKSGFVTVCDHSGLERQEIGVVEEKWKDGQKAGRTDRQENSTDTTR